MSGAPKSRKNFIERQIVEELRKSNSTLSPEGTIMYNGKEYKTNQMVKSLDKNYKGPNIRIKTLIQNINDNPGSSDHQIYFQPRKESYQSIRPQTVQQGSAAEMTPDEFKKTIKDFMLEGKSLSQQDKTLNEEYKKKYKRDIISEAEDEFYMEHKDSIDKQLEQEKNKEEELQKQYENAPSGNIGIQENAPFITPESDISKIVKNRMQDAKTEQMDQLEIEKKAIEDWKKEKAQDREFEQLQKQKERAKLLEILPLIVKGIELQAAEDPNFTIDNLTPETKQLFQLIDYTYGTDEEFDQFRNIDDRIKTVQKNIVTNKPMLPKITDITPPDESELHKKAEYGEGSGLVGTLLDKVPLPGGPVGTGIKWAARAVGGEVAQALQEGEDPVEKIKDDIKNFLIPGRDQTDASGNTVHNVQNIQSNQGFDSTMTPNVPESFAEDTSPTIDTTTSTIPPESVDLNLNEFLTIPDETHMADTINGDGILSSGPGIDLEMNMENMRDAEEQSPPTFSSPEGPKGTQAENSFNNFSQPGTYVGTIPPPTNDPTTKDTMTNQNLLPIDQGQGGSKSKFPTYKNAIHKNALIVYFGSYENPNWDWNLWQAYKGLDIGQNKSFFLNTTRSLFSLHGPDLLVDSLVYNEKSSAQQVFQEYMEIIELYKSFAGIDCCSSSSSDLVKIPKNDYDNIVSTLNTGNLPIQDSVNKITQNLKSKKMNKKQAMEELSKLIKIKKDKIISDQFMDKKILNTISNYELKQMEPTDIPRQYRKMWNGVPQIYNPTKIQQISDRVGRDIIPAIDNLNKGQIIMPKPNSIYVPAKGETKKMHVRIEIPKD